MSLRPERVLIYHITDVENLPGILAEGGLRSDVVMVEKNTTVIGYAHIKERRMKQIRVPCCGGQFVGEFVPFYFCPRSPMLFTINKGNTGRPAGCQRTIVHLVSTVAMGIGLERAGPSATATPGAAYPSFYANLKALAVWIGRPSGPRTGGERRTRSRRSFWWRISSRGRDFMPWVATTADSPSRCRIY